MATLASLISLIPGGIGITEGLLALIFTGAGITSGIVLISTLVFRFFSFWIWIPIGLASYITLKRSIQEKQ